MTNRAWIWLPVAAAWVLLGGEACDSKSGMSIRPDGSAGGVVGTGGFPGSGGLGGNTGSAGSTGTGGVPGSGGSTGSGGWDSAPGLPVDAGADGADDDRPVPPDGSRDAPADALADGARDLGKDAPAGEAAPIPCASLSAEADCETRNDCHSVYVDYENCGCEGLGCCAKFSKCAEGSQADCRGPATCKMAEPRCSGPYVVAYLGTCYEGCVRASDCAP